MAKLQVKNLFKTYSKERVLKGVSFEVQEGELISLLGPSGCGKTTTLRCIAGLEKPDLDSGGIYLGTETLNDGSYYRPPEKRQFGMVFQSYAVWPHMNVFENVAFPLRLLEKKLSF